jgi:peptide/nickel transport system substrate-binding protein
MSSRTKLLTLMLAVAMLAAACTSGGDDSNDADGGGVESDDISTAETTPAPDESGLTITRGGVITVGIVAESTGWYPPSAETAFSAGFLVMDALYDRWYHQTGTGEIVPMIAADRATPDDDADEWTMTIREGITFHDGTEVNAAAAVEMVEQWLAGPFGSSSTIERAEEVDEFTVRYFLKDPDPAFEQTLAGISTGAVFSPTAGRAFGPEDSVENPIGTGPFMFESWTRDSEMVVVRNPNYWRAAPDGGTLPYLDRIRFRVLSDADARRASFAAGDLDITTQGGPDGGPDLIADGAVPYEYIGNGAGVNIYNVLEPPFDDVRIRRAASHALNPENAAALSAPNLSGVLEIRTQYFNSTSPWYDEAAGADYALFDLAEAQRLADEYVNDPDRSDGKAVGDPVSFTYDCNTDPINLDRAQLFAQEWGDIGFDVEIGTTEQSSFVTKIVGTTSDPLFAGEFQVACFADGNEQDPLQLFRTRYGDGQVLNWTNYTSPEIDAQIEILRTELDPAVRQAAAAEISRITAEDMPIYWWASGATLVLTKPEIKGLETYTYPDGGGNERMSGGRVWWHEVWLDGASPLDDVPTDYLPIPDVPAVPDEPDEPDVTEPPTNDAVAAAMPPPPAGLTVGGTDPPLADLCPDVSLLDGIVPISATHQGYTGDPTFGPFPAISIYELAPGEADAIIGQYDLAVVDCAQYNATLNGAAIVAGYSARDLGSWGDETYSYGNAGTVDGFAIDSDIILVKTGDNLAVVTALFVLAPTDGTAAELAEAAAGILAGLG